MTAFAESAFTVAFGGKADMPFCTAKCLLLTQSGHPVGTRPP